jgi:DNA-binding MarR family transcriptional regulator
MDNKQDFPQLEQAMDAMRKAVKDASERLGEGLQLSRTQLEILLMFGEEPKTTGEIAKRLSLTQGAITQTVDTLVRRSLVERYPDELDRRVVRLRLSSAGEKITGNLRDLRQAKLHSLYSRLTPAEAQALIAIAGKMTEVIDETALKTK